jgi:hypothetical protein
VDHQLCQLDLDGAGDARSGQLGWAVTVICETPAVASMSKPVTPGAQPGRPAILILG